MTEGNRDVGLVYGPVARAMLVGWPPNAEWLVALLTRGYSGQYTDQISEPEVEQYLGELARTRLQTPLEFVQLVWLLRDVTRAFTHQLVRYRIGTSFVQESLRFAERQVVRVLVPVGIKGNHDALTAYREGMAAAADAFHEAIAAGASQQDARGLLPTNTLTNVYFGCSLRTLVHIYEQRLCCQAQSEEWTPLLQQMKYDVEAKLPRLGKALKAPWETGRLGCGFLASFDRSCSYADRFPK